MNKFCMNNSAIVFKRDCFAPAGLSGKSVGAASAAGPAISKQNKSKTAQKKDVQAAVLVASENATERQSERQRKKVAPHPRMQFDGVRKLKKAKKMCGCQLVNLETGLLTRDNLSKRRSLSDKTCLFCYEPESINHLFFECVVPTQAWEVIQDLFGVVSFLNFEYGATYWLSRKKHVVLNMFIAATSWWIWKLMNSICFQVASWKDFSALWNQGW